MSFCNKINSTLIVDTVKELVNRALHKVLFIDIWKAVTFHYNELYC